MLKTILIGLDGSDYSAAALDLALAWARETNALLVGLGILDEPDIRGSQAVPLGGAAFKEQMDDRKVHHARVRVEQILEQFALRCADQGVASKLLEDVGVPHEQIVKEAQRYDVVVLGQQTYFHFATQEEPDDTLPRVLKSSPRPVVVVPKQPSASSSVLVAYDGSLPAAQTLQIFQLLGIARQASIQVLSVAGSRPDAVNVCGRAVDFLRSHERNVQAVPVASSAAHAQVILDHVRASQPGLLVMGAYGHSGLREWFFGSTTQSLLRDSPIPMFMSH